MGKGARYNLKKLEEIIKSLGYKVIYEKGNFKSGYCVVEQSHVIVVNRFLAPEGRIGLLLEIVEKSGFPLSELETNDLKYLQKLRMRFIRD